MAMQAHSIVWEEALFGPPEPKWVTEPSIKAIKSIVRKVLHIYETEPVEINFLAQGAFNKLYTIQIKGRHPEHVIRVTLPVDPKVKVESEAATIILLDQHTDIPVPSIIAFDSSNQNVLGYEWILMKFMRGQMIATAWPTMTWPKKEELVRRVAQSLAQLFKHRFNGIGNVYLQDSGNSLPVAQPVADPMSKDQPHHVDHRLGEMVSMQLFWKDRLQQDSKRGPFRTSAEWLTTVLQLIINENREKIEKLTSSKSHTQDPNLEVGFGLSLGPEVQLESLEETIPIPALIHLLDSDSDSDSGEIEDAEKVIELAKRLVEAVPIFFPVSSTDEAEPTCLYHDDVNMHNILVNSEDQSKLSAILDWEFVSSVPLWKACQYPVFLRGKSRNIKPQRDGYFWPDPALVASGEECEQVMYDEHMLEYEQTILRPIFEAEMLKQVPYWSQVREKSVRQADFETAVSWCDSPITWGRVRDWLERTLAGEKQYRRLEEIYDVDMA